MSRKNRSLSSIVAKAIENSSIQIVNFVVGIVLARLLSPTDYGIYSILLIFISIGHAVVQGGFSSALIQRKKVDEKDYSTVFAFSIVAATVIYITLFMLAPVVGRLYKQPMLINPLRVIALTLFPNILYSIMNVKVAREMDFAFVAKLSVICVITVGMISIGLAYAGFGIWALIIQQIATYTILPLLYCIHKKWIPSLRFSINRFKRIIPFSSRLLLTDLLNAVYVELQGIIIGVKYTAESLAFFTRGQVFPRTIMTVVDSSFHTVLFPVYSEMQDNIKSMREMLLISLRMITFFVFPVMFGLFAVSDNMITIFLSNKWQGCIPYLRVYCIAYLFWPMDSIHLHAIKATGNGRLYLSINLVKKIMAATILLIAVFITKNVESFALSAIIVYIVDILIGSIAMKREIGISLRQEINAVAKNFVCALPILLVMMTSKYIDNTFIQVFIKLLLGVMLYLFLSRLVNRRCMDEVIDRIKLLLTR
jgi:O-antigen/teichoic acid export membrane protein